MRTLLTCLAVVALVGCDNKPSQSNVEQPIEPASTSATSPETTAKASPKDDGPGEPLLVAPQHPWAEEYHELVVTVTAEHDAEYRDAPSRGAEVVARQTLKPERKVAYERAETHVFEPFVTKATRQVKVSGATDAGEEVQQQLNPGDAYEAFLYAGEGMCYAKIDAKMAVGDCPDSTNFQAEGWKGTSPIPAKFDLWLQTRKGWWLVDRDKVDLEQVSTL